ASSKYSARAAGPPTELTRLTGLPSHVDSAESVSAPGPWHVTPVGSVITGAPSGARAAAADRRGGRRRAVRIFPGASSRIPQQRSPRTPSNSISALETSSPCRDLTGYRAISTSRTFDSLPPPLAHATCRGGKTWSHRLGNACV